MSKIKSDSLHHYALVMESDEDQPIVMQIYVGFDERDNLVVSIDNLDSEDRRYNCSTWASVSKGGAQRLARRHGVELYALPEFIADCMAEWRTIVNADFNQVRDCFKEITECLLDEGCRFRLGRTTGPRDFICC